jgi:proliferating cell nuclear antigen
MSEPEKIEPEKIESVDVGFAAKSSEQPSLTPSSMKLRIKDTKQFKDAMSAMATIVDEGTFHITDTGLQLRAMDPSRVAMVDFEWSKAMFEDFVLEKPQALCFAISTLIKLIRKTDKDDQIELNLIAGNKLQVSIVGKGNRVFTMPLLEASAEEVPTPKITFNVNIKLTVEALQNALGDAAVVSDHIKIEADSEKLVFSAAGDLLGATATMLKGSESLLAFEVKESQRAVFSLIYLTDITACAQAVSDVAVLEFSTDMPLKLTFLQAQPDIARLAYYVAPRIEPDE